MTYKKHQIVSLVFTNLRKAVSMPNTYKASVSCPRTLTRGNAEWDPNLRSEVGRPTSAPQPPTNKIIQTQTLTKIKNKTMITIDIHIYIPAMSDFVRKVVSRCFHLRWMQNILYQTKRLQSDNTQKLSNNMSCSAL